MSIEDKYLMSEEQLRDLRKQMLEGREITDEEISCVLTTLRGERSGIGAGKTAGTARTTRQPIDLGSLFTD